MQAAISIVRRQQDSEPSSHHTTLGRLIVSCCLGLYLHYFWPQLSDSIHSADIFTQQYSPPATHIYLQSLATNFHSQVGIALASMNEVDCTSGVTAGVTAGVL